MTPIGEQKHSEATPLGSTDKLEALPVETDPHAEAPHADAELGADLVMQANCCQNGSCTSYVHVA